MFPPIAPSSKAFENLVLNRLQDSGALITQVLVNGRRSMVEARLSTLQAHQLVPLHHAIHALLKFETTLIAVFPTALKTRFDAVLSHANVSSQRKASIGSLNSLSLVQDSEIVAQVELSRMRQGILSITEGDYVTLNTYVCAAQGLSCVRTDTNPFHPESYIRALQQAFEGVEVETESRQLWFQHMSTALGNELSLLYKEVTRELEEMGVTPVGYAAQRSTGSAPATTAKAAAMAGMSGMPGRSTGAATLPATDHKSAATAYPNVAPSKHHTPQASATHTKAREGKSPREMDSLFQNIQYVAALANAFSSPAGTSTSAAVAASAHEAAHNAAVTPQPPKAPAPAMSKEAATALLQQMLTLRTQHDAMPDALRHIVQSFEMSLIRLVQRDASVFTDDQHATHKLLDAVIQRGLSCTDENSTKFRKFTTLANETVRYLTALPVHDATAFEYMHRMWNRAWERPSAHVALTKASATNADALQDLTREIAEMFAQLPAAQHAPAKWIDFLTGPWAYVAARAHKSRDKSRANRYLAIAPTLLWSVQPTMETSDARRLLAWTGDLQSQIAEGLASIDYPAKKSSPWLRAIARLNVDLARMAYPDAATPDVIRNDTAATLTQVDILLEPYTAGQWFEMRSKERSIRTQLTWVNETQTSFVFTSPDGRSIPMTHRTVKELSCKGDLLLVATSGHAADNDFFSEAKHSSL